MVQGKTVPVEVIEYHTYDGIPREVGTQYDAEEGHVDFLTLRGYARPVPSAAADEPPTKTRKKSS